MTVFIMASNIFKVFQDKIAEVKAKRDEEIKKLKIQQQAALSREKEKERKARTRRLIQVGALIEKYCDVTFTDEIDLEAWVAENAKILKEHKKPVINVPQEPPAETEKICPRCGSPMRKKNGQYGEFWGCSSHPNCSHTESI